MNKGVEGPANSSDLSPVDNVTVGDKELPVQRETRLAISFYGDTFREAKREERNVSTQCCGLLCQCCVPCLAVECPGKLNSFFICPQIIKKLVMSAALKLK